MYIRYNQGIQMWEYDTSGGGGVGPWLVLPIDYAQIVNPPIIVPPDPLPPNIAYRDIDNIWSVLQTMRQGNPAWYFDNTLGAVNSRVFRIITTPSTFFIQSLDDALTVVQGQLEVDRLGHTRTSGQIRSNVGFYERSRPNMMGHWQDVVFSAANFFAVSGGGTWTVGPAAIIRSRFTLIGLTMHWSLYISWFSGDNAIAGNVTVLGINIPGGFNCPGNMILHTAYAIDPGVGRVELDAGPSTSSMLTFNKRDSSPFGAGAVGIIGGFTFEVSGAGVNVDV